jgi:drug/metabolite transporter (DMT)-like permease
MQTSYLRGVLFCLVATVSWGSALVMNNLYQRQRVQRESASPYGHTAAANYLRRKPN